MAALADWRPLATIAVLYVTSVVAYARLPAGTVGPGLIAFTLPTAAAGILALMRLLAAHDHVRGPQQTCTRADHDIVFRIVLFIGALQGVVLIGLFGGGLVDRTGPIVPRLAPLLFGAGLMGIGNLLPRLRPNVAIGIRTSRTLHDRQAWLRVNRRAGYVTVALGFAIMAAALLVRPGPDVVATVGAIGMLAVVALVAWTWKDAHGRGDAVR
jgi:hypothetical protein